MRKARKTAVILAAILVAVLVGACGKPFDASGYVKALLDNSYKGDSAEFVAQKVGTKQQAEELYNQGIDTEMKSLTSQANVSEELQGEFREVLQNIFKNVKYTVGEAAKKDDSYEVEVKYQKMKIFEPAIESFNTTSQDYINWITEKPENGEESPSEEELNEEIFTLLKDALINAMDNVSFGDEESTVIHVELKDNTWMPNEADVQNLEKLLFDMEVLEELQ